MQRTVVFLLCIITLSIAQTGYSNAYAGQSKTRLIVYYFHSTVRCPSCILLEQITRDAVTSGFVPEIRSGRIELKVINIDEPTNSHFQDRYNLSFQSVIISKVVNGVETKWKNLERVWEYLHEEDTLTYYIQKEINLYLNESKS